MLQADSPAAHSLSKCCTDASRKKRKEMQIKITCITIVILCFLSCQEKESDMFGSKLPLSKIDYDFYYSISRHGEVDLFILDLGVVNITSGQIVACDPLVNLGNTAPFTKKIKPGKYPVKICVAKSTEMGTRYAFAKLQVSDTKTVKWELAITEDLKTKVKELKDNEYFGFPVDAGLGSFCDNKTQSLYVKFEQEFLENNKNANMYDDFFADKFKENAIDKNDPNDIGDWLNFTIPTTENNIIMFHSGYGDGYYPVYWGYDQKGSITALLIDFMLFGYDE